LKKLSVVVPVYFNQETLEALHAQLQELTTHLPDDVVLEFVFVDDGSADDSRAILRAMAARDKRVRLVFLSRNFGSFTAILAGLNYASGDCTAIISADLQDPPGMIPQMYGRWLAGDKTVMAVRAKREDSWGARLFSSMAYSLLRRMALPTMPKGGFDFVLIDRQVKGVLIRTGERNTSLMGLIVWAGFRQSQIPYTRRERAGGKSRWNFGKKLKYLIDSLLAFSYVPIRLMSAVGIIIGSAGFLYALVLIVMRLFQTFDVPGWTALMVVTLVLFGFLFLSLGIIGEYLWRTLDESRSRPVFIVEETVGIERGTGAGVREDIPAT